MLAVPHTIIFPLNLFYLQSDVVADGNECDAIILFHSILRHTRGRNTFMKGP